MKNILITGGSRGIGRAMTEKFSQNGWRVFFTYEKEDILAKQVSDITGAYRIKGMNASEIKKVIKKYGKLNALINNAGISEQKMFQDITNEDWDRMFDINMRKIFEITREFYTDFINQKKGSIINISSIWGISGASCEVHYSASKAAVIGFTKALAKEAGPSGVRVNCIAPGVIDTDMNSNIDKEEMENLKYITPLGRLGKPEDVADLAVYLCSDAAEFVTGQVICCDGGFLV